MKTVRVFIMIVKGFSNAVTICITPRDTTEDVVGDPIFSGRLAACESEIAQTIGIVANGLVNSGYNRVELAFTTDEFTQRWERAIRGAWELYCYVKHGQEIVIVPYEEAK